MREVYRAAFSVGKHSRHAEGLRQMSGSFDDLAAFVTSHQGADKDGLYVCGPLRDGHRCEESALPVAWAALDLDKIADELALLRIVEAADRWLGCCYTTFSHKPEAGIYKLRLIFALDREVNRAEYRQVCRAIAAGLQAVAGVPVEIDLACAKPEQPLYTARHGAQTWRFDGSAVRVDAALLCVPDEPQRVSPLEDLKTSDPVLAALRDQGRVLRDMGGGKFAIRCPFEAGHSTAHKDGDSSTCYMLPFTNGYERGCFACKHESCDGRRQSDFRRALGLAPEPAEDAQDAQDAKKSCSGNTASCGQDGQLGVEIRRADTVTPEPIRWEWPDFLAGGKLHVLAAPPGSGKTTIALSLAAIKSSGGRWPDGTRAKPGRVLIWSGEDDAADTLVPRLEAMGADRSRIAFIEAATEIVDGTEQRVAFDPARHFPALAAALATDPPALLIVDPIVSAVSGDSHKNAEVRRGLQPLVDLARQLGVAVLGITHFSKGTQGRDPTERVTGSLAFGALARIVFVAAKTRDEGRVFMKAKANITVDEGGFKYDLEQVAVPAWPGVFASRVLWGEPIQGNAREVLADAEAVEDEARSLTDEAEDFLREILSSGGIAAADAIRQARANGISDKALRSARQRLGVKPVKSGFSAGWWWSLPAHEPEDAEVF